MNIDITGRQIEITPALREFTEDKLQKLRKLMEGPLEVHVVLGVEKHRHVAEIKVKSRTVVLAGAEETGDLYASIGEVVDKLERQALKHKDKATSRRRRDGGRAASAAVREAEAAAAGEEEGEATTAAGPRIVRSRRYRLKPLSPEDAVMEMESSGEDLLVFRDSRTYRVNVLFRRRNGDLELVDPQF